MQLGPGQQTVLQVRAPRTLRTYRRVAAVRWCIALVACGPCASGITALQSESALRLGLSLARPAASPSH
jgi:hypothetical protein